MAEKEMNLIDFINILLKRKWLIIIPTFVLAVLVGIISFLLPPKWGVDAIIEPARFLATTTGGGYIEVLAAEPLQIAEQINKETYSAPIALELGLSLTEFPKLIAQNPEETKIVHVSMVEKDREKAKRILNTLFTLIQEGVDIKANVELGLIEEEIKTLNSKHEIVNKRILEIGEELKEVKSRNQTIEKEQRQNLARVNRNETESLALLLYSNTIQGNLRYLTTLNELLNEKIIEEEEISNDIMDLEERKGRIELTKFVKRPTASPSPVFPKKKFNILIALVLGSVIFTIIAVLLEQIESQKSKPQEK